MENDTISRQEDQKAQTPTSLSSTLFALRTRTSEEIATLEKDLAVEQAELDAILSEIARLQSDLQIKEDSITLLQGELVQQHIKLIGLEQEEIQSSLNNCLKKIIIFGKSLHAKEQIQAEKQRQLQSDPELDKKLHEYQQLKQNSDTVLQTFSSLYRQVMLDLQETYKIQLQPYLDLLEQEKEADVKNEFSLEVVISPVENPTGYTILLPLPGELNDTEPEAHTFLESLKRLIDNGITSLIENPDWKISTLEVSDWHGLSLIELEGNYKGEAAVKSAVQNVFTEFVSSPLSLQGITLNCTVSQVVGLKSDHPIPPELLIEVTPPTKNDAPSVNVGNSGDTAQIETPEEKAELLEAALIIQKIERTRQILIQMLGHAQVRTRMVPVATLQQNINLSAFEDFDKEIAVLVQADILKSFPNDSHVLEVTLNSERVPEVQDLINRDITAFWEQIINPNTVLTTF